MDTPSNATVRCVGGIAHDPQGRLLLIRRGNDPDWGMWSIPGGRVERDETDIEAVVRELREETGLDVTPSTLVGSLTYGPYEIFDYTCAVDGGVLRAGDDASDAQWADAAKITELLTAGQLRERLFVTLRDWGVLPHH
ncbi:NUDIX hydrolase [Amycolatopsis sp. H20-H5]|uniref:NUDIX hydrolase n=1 Tax=Amycolatopsis sp. H20-H5 TaxID=3046309 RepID=UPI002DB6BA98|nr:NUDIX domain-containing protein [Amycolatopsis sp. H20-H5]MEC3979264.1 NUDIX domain-containing protein [Amycolatopsis sp. H20-H5]